MPELIFPGKYTLNVLKADKVTKFGVKNKRLKACRDENYLAALLLAM